MVSLPEREVESAQKGARLVVGFRRRANDHVETQYAFSLIVVDFREHDMFLDSHRVVAMTIETLRVERAKIPDSREGDRDQAVEELIHAGLAQGNLRSDRHVLAHLECRDRLAGVGYDRLLARDQGKI